MKANIDTFKLFVTVSLVSLALFFSTRHTVNNHGIAESTSIEVLAQLGTTDSTGNPGGGTPGGGGTGGFDYAIDRQDCQFPVGANIKGSATVSIITQLFGLSAEVVANGYANLRDATCLYRPKNDGETGYRIGNDVTCAMVFEKLLAALND